EGPDLIRGGLARREAAVRAGVVREVRRRSRRGTTGACAAAGVGTGGDRARAGSVRPCPATASTSGPQPGGGNERTALAWVLRRRRGRRRRAERVHRDPPARSIEGDRRSAGGAGGV